MSHQRRQTRPASQRNAEQEGAIAPDNKQLDEVQEKLEHLREEQRLREARVAEFSFSPESVSMMSKLAGISDTAEQAQKRVEDSVQVGGQ